MLYSLYPPEVSLCVSNKWGDNKMTQLSICQRINKMFDLLHLLCEWCRSGKSLLVNPQSFCSSALTWIYRFVWVFRSAAWLSKFSLMGDFGLVDLVILQQCEGQEAKAGLGFWRKMGSYIKDSVSLCIQGRFACCFPAWLCFLKFCTLIILDRWLLSSTAGAVWGN